MFKDKPYQIIKKDKQTGKLSHAYMINARDINLDVYLKSYAKIILCDNGEDCNECRSCRLIDKGILPDCKQLIKSSILVDDVNQIVDEVNFKPIEKTQKVFLISDFAYANEQAQNKLLKVLEEPPKNVIFLLATSSEHKVLPTIKSRVKMLELSPFTESQLFSELSREYEDKEKLKSAVALSGGYREKAKMLYSKQSGERELVLDILTNMQKSNQIPIYTKKINKDNIAPLVGLLKIIFADITKYQLASGGYMFFEEKDVLLSKLASEYKTGACLELIEKLDGFEKNLYFNGNVNMVADVLLFSLLEVKYKWQKL